MCKDEISIKKDFFDIQVDSFDSFFVQLYGYSIIHLDGEQKNIQGLSTTKFLINKTPVGGKCFIKQEKDEWTDAYTGFALVELLKLSCDNDWKDPENHRISKYQFKCEYHLQISIQGEDLKMSCYFEAL